MATYDEPEVPALAYVPDEETKKTISDIKTFFERAQEDRLPYERTWYVTAAMDRGQHYVEWNQGFRQLSIPKAPPHRVRLKIPRMQSKLRARIAKFLKNRPRPIVVPATNEYEDYQNAKATQKALDYLWRKLKLEQKYKEALLWAKNCSKGFWWIHWDPTKIARIAVKDPVTGIQQYHDVPIGDVDVEVGSPFEIFVQDPGVPQVSDQPRIQRAKMRELEDVKARYPEFAPYLTGMEDQAEPSAFRYEKQISLLSPQASGLTMAKKPSSKKILVIEDFFKPCGKYPSGCYHVLAGDILVKNEEALPWGLTDYPMVAFSDLPVAGQFWGPTLAEQLIDLQREYNLLRSKLSESLRMMAYPKLLVAVQHQVPKAAWTSEPGEVVEYIAHPSIPPPSPWFPPNVSGDLWKALEMIREEFDAITQIYPVAEGAAGGTESGFQANLLQEATDSIHAPDIRSHELSIESASVKLRALMKQGYDIPRLLTTLGSNNQAEVIEFSAAQIDEMADIIVEVGSALPVLKAAKQESVLTIYREGLLGDQQDPEVKRRTLGMLEIGGLEEAYDFARQDEAQARLENKELQEGKPLNPPRFWENHQTHYSLHAHQLKSAETRMWDPTLTRTLIAHSILHVRYFDPMAAMHMAQEEQMPELIPIIQPLLPPPPPGMGPQGPPPPGGEPPPPGMDQGMGPAPGPPPGPPPPSP